MSYDNRYIGIEPLDRCAIGPIRKGCAEIARRTGTRPFYNRFSRKVIFVYGDEPAGGPLSLPVLDGRAMEPHAIDLAVEWVQMGKVDRREKDRIAARNERHEADEKESAKAKFQDDRRPDAVSYAQRLDRRRRGTQSTTVVL